MYDCTVCMYVRMYLCMHACMYACKYACRHATMYGMYAGHVCMRVRMYLICGRVTGAILRRNLQGKCRTLIPRPLFISCEPAQLKCTWTSHTSHLVWKFTGKMPLALCGEKGFGQNGKKCAFQVSSYSKIITIDYWNVLERFLGHDCCFQMF